MAAKGTLLGVSSPEMLQFAARTTGQGGGF